jgi:hypothetical protein
VAEKERVSQDKTVIARKYELDAKNNWHKIVSLV